MARSRKPASKKQPEQYLEPTHQEDTDDDNEVEVELEANDSESELDKDETELELEKAVFGDSAGFRQHLRDVEIGEANDEDELPDGGFTGLEGLDDAQLFFTDIGDESAITPKPATSSDADSEDETIRSKRPAAWEDSDDERMMVSLANVPRLRKLRKTEAEDVVDGKEYSKRLRRQFEALNGVPEWATYALKHPSGQGPHDLDASSGDEEMDVDSDVPNVAPLSSLLRDSSSLVRRSNIITGSGSKKRKLRPEVLDIQRIKDIDGVQPSSITSLSFHPELPLLLSSGPSSTLYLHHITPSPPAPSLNPLLTSLHVSGTQLTTTAFHPADARIFLSARRRYFHVWDLQSGQVEKVTRVYGHQHEQRTMERFKLSPCGRYVAFLGSVKKGGGVINILSASTLQWQAQARVESGGGIAEFAWWCNGQGLAIVGKNGEVTEWSMVDQNVVARWQDEGAVGTTTLALGGRHGQLKSPIGPDRWIAIGSSSGIVNIYDRQAWLNPTNNSIKQSSQQPIPTNPKPVKALDHLTHPISHLVFSPDGQIMAMASFWKKDHMRLVHLPSCTVYRNWPTSATPLGRITSVAFAGGDILEEGIKGGSGSSLHSLLAVANEQGKIRLFEIR